MRPTHAVGCRGDVHVADAEGGVVRRYALGPRPRQTAVVPARGAPHGIAADPRGGRLWVTMTARNLLAGLSPRGGRPRRVAAYPTVRQPNSVTVDPATGAVFAAGRGDGELQRIEPGSGEGR